MGAQAFHHLAQQQISLLDLFLLDADFFLRLTDVRAMAIDQRIRFRAAFVVRLDSVFG